MQEKLQVQVNVPVQEQEQVQVQVQVQILVQVHVQGQAVCVNSKRQEFRDDGNFVRVLAQISLAKISRQVELFKPVFSI